MLHGLVAQLGAHHIRIVGVEGSNPFKSTKRKATSSEVAFLGMGSTQKGFEQFDPACHRQAGRRVPPRAATPIFAKGENANESLQVYHTGADPAFSLEIPKALCYT